MSSKNKELKNQINSRYYHKNKEKILSKLKETSKDFYEKNKDVLLERAKKSREKHYESRLYSSAKQRAEKDGIPFNISLEDIVIPEQCVFLKTPLTRTQGKGRVWTNASIDRIDNTKGYIKGNIQIISLKANVMKSLASLEELKQFSKSCLELYR